MLVLTLTTQTAVLRPNTSGYGGSVEPDLEAARREGHKRAQSPPRPQEEQPCCPAAASSTFGWRRRGSASGRQGRLDPGASRCGAADPGCVIGSVRRDE